MSVDTAKGYWQSLFCQYLEFFTDILLYSLYGKIGYIGIALLKVSFKDFSIIIMKLWISCKK